MDVVNGNVNSTLKSLIVNGSELAVDNGFASYLGIGTSNSVYWYLQQQELPSSAIAIAVVGKNGLLASTTGITAEMMDHAGKTQMGRSECQQGGSFGSAMWYP